MQDGHEQCFANAYADENQVAPIIVETQRNGSSLMTKPAIVSLGFIILEHCVYRRSVQDMLVVLCSCQVVECAHVSSVCGPVFTVGLLVNRPQLMNEIRHQGR